MINSDRLKDRLKFDAKPEILAIYNLLAHAHLADEMTVRPSGHGYISRELRFEHNHDWLFSAVLNKGWILWYCRRPALNRFAIAPNDVRRVFPRAEITGQLEVKLRLKDQLTAFAVLGFMNEVVSSPQTHSRDWQ